MKASILPRYLLGSRSAILDIAASRSALLIGALFVISAGLAREYDGENLLHEPWHILRPLAASLLSGSLLFAIVYLAACVLRRADGEGVPLAPGRAYLSFMGLFWMTAPLAWLYAVPYERVLSPVDAVEVNLWTLALVALWRVLLMTRVVSVIYGIGLVPAFFFVMLFSDIVTFTAMSLVPTPIIDVMGGVRHSARDQLVADTTFLVQVLSVLSLPVWVIGALIALCRIAPRFPTLPEPASRSRSLLAFALASIVAFTPLLIIAQPEQIRRHTAERMLLSGRVADGLAYMSRFEVDDFPPQWEPPPRLGYGEDRPWLGEIREAMWAQRPAPWVEVLYLEKLRTRFMESLYRYKDDDPLSEVIARMEDNGEIYALSTEHIEGARLLLRDDTMLTHSERTALDRILRAHDPARVGELSESEVTGQLIGAAHRGDLATVKAILATGRSPDLEIASKYTASTALGQAARMNRPEIAEALLDAGAHADKGTYNNLATPAHIAASYGSLPVLKLLLDRGADPHAGSDEMGSLIFAAVFGRHHDTVRELIDRQLGIDIQRGRAKDRWTPLHAAYFTADPVMVEFLLQAGADPHARDASGRLPSDMKR